MTTRYLFDFDRTVFDMEGLYTAIATTNPTVELGTVASLENIDLTGLLFQDALDFFAAHDRSQIDILSSGHGKTGTWDPAYQSEKVRLSGVDAYVNQIHIVAKDKVSVLKEVSEQCEDRIVFVDDHPDNVVAVATALPQILTVYLDRLGDGGVSADIPRIESLSELDAIIAV